MKLGDFMKGNYTKYLISLYSITYATKAKKLLNSYGFFCEIKRTPRDFSTGCGYSIVVIGEIYEILSILEENNIANKGYTEMVARI